MIGAIERHGPHHGAQASISTGFAPALRSTWSIVASVTVIGLPPSAAVRLASSFMPQLPHFGCISVARSSIRFLAPQLGHWTIGMARNSCLECYPEHESYPAREVGRIGRNPCPVVHVALSYTLRFSRPPCAA